MSRLATTLFAILIASASLAALPVASGPLDDALAPIWTTLPGTPDTSGPIDDALAPVWTAPVPATPASDVVSSAPANGHFEYRDGESAVASLDPSPATVSNALGGPISGQPGYYDLDVSGWSIFLGCAPCSGSADTIVQQGNIDGSDADSELQVRDPGAIHTLRYVGQGEQGGTALRYQVALPGSQIPTVPPAPAPLAGDFQPVLRFAATLPVGQTINGAPCGDGPVMFEFWGQYRNHVAGTHTWDLFGANPDDQSIYSARAFGTNCSHNPGDYSTGKDLNEPGLIPADPPLDFAALAKVWELKSIKLDRAGGSGTSYILDDVVLVGAQPGNALGAQADDVVLTFTDGSPTGTPSAATCTGTTLYTVTSGGLGSGGPAGASCLQVTVQGMGTVALPLSVSGFTSMFPDGPIHDDGRLLVDIDLTPMSGEGCDDREWHGGMDCADNSIDESGDADGDNAPGQDDDQTPTWIRVGLRNPYGYSPVAWPQPGLPVLGNPANPVPTYLDVGAGNLFADKHGLMLTDLHIKWPSDAPGPNTSPDFATYATKYSNLDNDDNTDFEELVQCGGSLANPTNPLSDCDDWDGDRTKNGADSTPFTNQLLQARLANATTGALLGPGPYNAPFNVDVQIRCALPPATVASVVVDLGSGFVGRSGSQSISQRYAMSPALCDDGWHSTAGAGFTPLDAGEVGGIKPTYNAYVTETSSTSDAITAVTTTQDITIGITAVRVNAPTESGSLGFTLNRFNLLNIVTAGARTNAPIDLATIDARVTCTLAPGFTEAPTSTAINLATDAAKGDELRGSATTMGCSNDGVDTPLTAAYFNNAGPATDFIGANDDILFGNGARTLNLRFTAQTPGGNNVGIYVSLPMSPNVLETGTLSTSCTPSPCLANSPTIDWTFTHTSNTDEQNQGLRTVTLIRDPGVTNVRIPMVQVGTTNKWTVTESGRTPMAVYAAEVEDGGKRVTALYPSNGRFRIGLDNSPPTIAEFNAPVEALITPDSKVTTVFTASVFDSHGAGASSLSGDTVNAFLRYWEFESASGSVNPTVQQVAMGPVDQTGLFFNSAGDQDWTGFFSDNTYFATADLSPGKGYRYCFFVQDSGGLSDADPGASCPGSHYTHGLPILPSNPTDGQPGRALERPLSFVLLGSGLAVDTALAFVDQQCEETGTVTGAKVQKCLEEILLEGVCGFPEGTTLDPSDPGALAGCKGDVQQAVADLFDDLENQACGPDGDQLATCVPTKVENARQDAIDLICSLDVGNLLAPCGGDAGEAPVPDPVRVLTEDDCDFTRPVDWASQMSLWDDSCNGDAETVNDLVNALVEVIGGQIPAIGLPGDAIDPEDRNNNGDTNEPNGQLDYVESRIVALDPDETPDDPSDPFDGTTGLTLHFFTSGSANPTAAPQEDYIVRLGDVQGTDATEILVFQDFSPDGNVNGQIPFGSVPNLVCILAGNTPGAVSVHQSNGVFRASDANPCGPAVQTTNLRLSILPGQGFMLWEDRDGDGRRTSGDVSNDGDASRTGNGDLVGVRLQCVTDTPGGFRLVVNTAGTLQQQQTAAPCSSADGFVASYAFPQGTPSGPGFVISPDGDGNFFVDVRAKARGATGYSDFTGPLTLTLRSVAQSPDFVVGPVSPSGGVHRFTVAADGLPSMGAGNLFDVFVSRSGPASDSHFFVPKNLAAAASAELADTMEGLLPAQAFSPVLVLTADTVLDADGDGFTVVEELLAVDPTDPDSIGASDPDDPDSTPADFDGDGVENGDDAFPHDPAHSSELDNDGIRDAQDNCPTVDNSDQKNTDAAPDGGDACDTDDDNDGFSDSAETAAGTDPLNASKTPTDSDGDGRPNATDNCPAAANADQADADADGKGDVCDGGIGLFADGFTARITFPGSVPVPDSPALLVLPNGDGDVVVKVKAWTAGPTGYVDFVGSLTLRVHSLDGELLFSEVRTAGATATTFLVPLEDPVVLGDVSVMGGGKTSHHFVPKETLLSMGPGLAELADAMDTDLVAPALSPVVLADPDVFGELPQCEDVDPDSTYVCVNPESSALKRTSDGAWPGVRVHHANGTTITV